MVDSGAGGGGPWTRWEPLAGIAFPLLFVLSVVLSNVPAATAGDAAWTAAYTGAGNQAGHFAAGVCLVLAGPRPGADALRLANDMGFGMVALAGMTAAALSIAGLTVQGRAAG